MLQKSHLIAYKNIWECHTEMLVIDWAKWVDTLLL